MAARASSEQLLYVEDARLPGRLGDAQLRQLQQVHTSRSNSANNTEIRYYCYY